MFQGHIEKVAGAAGGVEHAHVGQADLEGADQFDRLGVLALFVQAEGGAVDRGPFLAQGLDDGRQDQALDIGARGVVGAQLMPLQGVERALQAGCRRWRARRGASRRGRRRSAARSARVQRQGRGRGEEPAVEAQHALAQDHRKGAAAVHVAPQVFGQGHELGGVITDRAQQGAEGGGGQQADVLGEQGEQTADQEGGGRPAAGGRRLRVRPPGAPGGRRCRG